MENKIKVVPKKVELIIIKTEAAKYSDVQIIGDEVDEEGYTIHRHVSPAHLTVPGQMFAFVTTRC